MLRRRELIFGIYPSCSMTFCTFFLVSSLIPSRLFMTNDTVVWDTPASWEIFFMFTISYHPLFFFIGIIPHETEK